MIVHNNPSPPPPPPPAGGGMGALNKIFNQGGSVCSISIVPGRKLNKTQLKLEFCFPNSDHVMFSREFAFCLFINYDTCAGGFTCIGRHLKEIILLGTENKHTS